MYGKNIKSFRIIIFLSILSLALILCSISVSAHSGRTDSNGGHTDHSTGDYHFHHGYPAHAHYDMDNDGDLDCPYEFDDQTNHFSGATSSSGSYVTGEGDGYSTGYSDGYKIGYTDGKEDGIRDAKNEYENQLVELDEQYRKQRSSQTHSVIIIVTILTIVALMAFTKFVKKTKLKWDLSVQSRINSEIDHLNAKHNDEIRKYRMQIKNLQRSLLLEKISAGDDPSIQLPQGVRLKRSYTPIKGSVSKNYPYGDYTVFIALTGKKYHCKCDCVSSAKPMHFFDLPQTAEPCLKCLRKDMYPPMLPDWYFQIQDRLDKEK